MCDNGSVRLISPSVERLPRRLASINRSTSARSLNCLRPASQVASYQQGRVMSEELGNALYWWAMGLTGNDKTSEIPEFRNSGTAISICVSVLAVS